MQAYQDIRVGKLQLTTEMNRVRFPNPVAVGSNLRSRSKMISVDKVNDECFQVLNEVTIVIEGQEKAACAAEVVFRHYY